MLASQTFTPMFKRNHCAFAERHQVCQQKTVSKFDKVLFVFRYLLFIAPQG